MQEVIAAKLITSFDKTGAVKNPTGVIRGGDTIYLRLDNHSDIMLSGYMNKEFLTITVESGHPPVLHSLQGSGGSKFVMSDLMVVGEGIVFRGGAFRGPLEI